MYRPSVDNRIKCYDPPGAESQNKLKAALKKLFCDICETLISFQHRLEISGTIGITIDSESVMLLQFSEAFLSRKPASPAVFHDGDPKINDTPVMQQKNWMSTPHVANADQKLDTNICRNPASNTLGRDATPDIVSKNGSGSNLANSSDSNDCLIGYSHLEPCISRAVNNETSFSKIEPAHELNKSSVGDVSEVRSGRRSNSMLSQLLQRPPSSSDVFSNLPGQGNQFWAAPVSASEMLKKMSSRVDGSSQDGTNIPENKANNGVKSEPVCCPSLHQGKATNITSSPGSSYLRELLFQKASDQHVQRTQKDGSERKRKRNKPEQEIYFVENDREENGQGLEVFNGQAFNNESNTFAQLPGGFFLDSKTTGGSPSPNAEFSEYRYSMLLHKLVDVRRSQKLDSNSCNNFLPTLNSRVENSARPFNSLNQTFMSERVMPMNSSDLWPQGIKSEVTDREFSESPNGQNEDALIKFDNNDDHTNDNNRDSDV